jgi:hypothetical protein
MMTTFKVRDKERVLEISELPEDPGPSYELIGTAEGASDDHCLFMLLVALERRKGSGSRVVGYRRTTPSSAQAVVAIKFYAEPGPRDWSPRKKKD